jgi:MscS family membrane protein
VDLLVQRVPRGDGVYIWKISNATVKKIPELYEIYGYGRIGDYLSKKFPDYEILGLQLWQWVAMIGLLIYSFIIAFLPLWVIAFIVRRKKTELRNRVAKLLLGPVWIFLAILINRANFDLISPTVAYRAIMEAYTGPIIVGMWVFLRLTDLMSEVMRGRFERQDRHEATVLLRPAATATKILGIIIAMMFWLDNMGLRVSTILASLGVGGLAFALAAQDTLKNFIGSVIILLDKPFTIGQRIVAKGHDGVVEAIGFRSTKLRLLTGHQAIIPNETMAKENIENIGRRPHIRRLTNIHLSYDTPLEKVRKAVDIIQGILDDHEGMDPEFPPRVYFNEFNRDSLNIMIFYWYHPNDYWAYCEFSEKVNVKIMEAFEKEDIKFALPTSTTYLAGVDEKLPEMISSKGPGERKSR